jgi:predicted nuclease of predicted toxin-antitoxin system
VRLLLDEHLSPVLVDRCLDRGIYATSVARMGLGGTRDRLIWRYAFDHDFVVVTTNARDFLVLAELDLHPGLIVIRESGLTRDEQWERLAFALDYLGTKPESPGMYGMSHVIEVVGHDDILDREVPRR